MAVTRVDQNQDRQNGLWRAIWTRRFTAVGARAAGAAWLDRSSVVSPAPEAVSRSPATALIIDDSDLMRYALREMLEADGGWRVIGEAADGARGRELAEQFRPDVIVLDQEMPGETGLQALPELRRLCPQAVIVMWTANPAEAAAAHALGVDALIDKAQPMHDLTDALRHAA